MRIVGRVPRALGATALIAIALGATGSAALGAGSAAKARSVAACANERVVGNHGLEVFYAFRLHRASCATAHALITSYTNHVSAGRGCSGRGTMCGYEIGSWWCSLPGYAHAAVDAGCCYNGGRPYGSCARRGASFEVLETSPPTGRKGQLHLRLFETPDGSVSCESEAIVRGYTRCSISSRNEFAVPAAWMEAPRVRVCTQREELVQPEGEGSACPALALDRRVTLADGQENELGGIRCAVAATGVTCTFLSGANAGKGFRISSSEVVQMG
jgi:hypothetical protein